MRHFCVRNLIVFQSNENESKDISLIAFKTLKDLVKSKRKGKEQNKETTSSPAAQFSNKQKAKKFLTDIAQRQSPSPKLFWSDIGLSADDDVDYTPNKPKKPEQHKYWVQPGLLTSQSERGMRGKRLLTKRKNRLNLG
ncbi:hypothetical protein PoB_005643700 [Plakobranchus ocellatus]|uniref:RRP15-like protein n=1 Tax=Plakobranchus ocellatus TaxID=259542 RepID=A0AAV4CEZ6_9GAST|nr:hypothetical protein PoB_005643700 [Plakobranchus ocellatus]